MTLKEYQSCFSLSYSQFLTRYNVQPAHIVEDVGYEKITPATRVQLSGNEFFFFKDGALALIYISDDVLTRDVWAEFQSAHKGEPGESLRSRAGKTSNQEVFAEQGFTVSIKRGEVDFIEIYASRSPEQYLVDIYQEVRPFIR